MNWAREKALNIVKRLTISEKIGLLSTSQTAVPRVGLPEFNIGGEAAHGIVDREKYHTTSFPIPLVLSQTWNPELTKEVGSVISDEARALYNTTGRKNWLMPWAPTIDLERDPRWGRNEEGYGEDPYLTGQVSGGLIRGFQGQGHFLKIAAAPKHFFANNNEEGRGGTSNTIIPTMKNEYYLKPFKFAFCNWQAQSMMTAYNGINGIPAMQSPELKKVKKDWQMDGCIVTDGGALTLNIEEYHYYNNYPEAVADALKKGIDCFVDDKEKVETAAITALKDGIILEKDIDRAVTNTLKVRIQLGQLKDTDTPYDYLDEKDIGSQDHDEIVQKVYAEGTVLLKNDQNLLPLDEQQEILLTGPLADTFPRDWYATQPMNYETLLQGLKKRLGKHLHYVDSDDNVRVSFSDIYLDDISQNVFKLERWQNQIVFLRDIKNNRYLKLNDDGKLTLGNTEVYDWVVKEAFYLRDNKLFAIDHNFTTSDVNSLTNSGLLKPEIGQVEVISSGIERVIKAANHYSTTIFVGGNHPMINARETEDRHNIELSLHQQKLCTALANTLTKTIALFLGGYPFVTDQLSASSILFSGYAGQSMGTALTKVIFGDIAPTGKLSQTWYNQAWQETMPDLKNYDIEMTERTYQFVSSDKVTYPFGYGLTYGKMRVDQINADLVHSRIKIRLSNHEQKAVTETIQVYLIASGLNNRHARQQLIAFKKVTLSGQTSSEINLDYDLTNASWYDPKTKQFYWPNGFYCLGVGVSSSEILKKISLKLPKTNLDMKLSVLSAAQFDDYQNIRLISYKKQYELVNILPGGFVTYRNLILPTNQIQISFFANNDGILTIKNDENVLAYLAYQTSSQEQKQSVTLAHVSGELLSLKIESSASITIDKIITGKK